MKTLQDKINSNNILQNNYSDINLNQLLKGDKKIVSFVGTSKSGASCLLNNIAHLLSSKGIDVAILDTTRNRNTYYVYTKNEESLRKTAYSCMGNLVQGVAKGIKVNENLTVYTDLPGENKYINEVESILETLIKKHSLILMDCDLKTPMDYFEYAMELYLVQTMDVLTIQPLTEFLSELKNRGILRDSKIRIILNKYVQINGITEKEIIGGMSYYNDPAMSYMKELFNRNLAKYITIELDRSVYERYLEDIAKCDINLNGYPQEFIEKLKQLCNEIYPFSSNNR